MSGAEDRFADLYHALINNQIFEEGSHEAVRLWTQLTNGYAQAIETQADIDAYRNTWYFATMQLFLVEQNTPFVWITYDEWRDFSRDARSKRDHVRGTAHFAPAAEQMKQLRISAPQNVDKKVVAYTWDRIELDLQRVCYMLLAEFQKEAVSRMPLTDLVKHTTRAIAAHGGMPLGNGHVRGVLRTHQMMVALKAMGTQITSTKHEETVIALANQHFARSSVNSRPVAHEVGIWTAIPA